MQAQQQQQVGATDGVLEGFLTRDELAKELRVTTRTLIRWKWKRKGPPSVVIAGRVYYKRAAVRNWMNSLPGAGGDA